MKHFQTDGSYTLIFRKGEQLIANLTEFCRGYDIKAAFFYGLGGVLSAELGYYDLESREYVFQQLDQVVEIASLQGNMALKDGEPFIHAHAVLSGADLRAYAGHVKELTVGGTCEIHMRTFPDAWHREYDEETGLSLINFPA